MVSFHQSWYLCCDHSLSINAFLMQQSGRMEEEIELLQYKLRQVEEGMAFSGRKTKIARSQGKKVQITVQKEYSRFVHLRCFLSLSTGSYYSSNPHTCRLLGNLAWAYMQQKDFKSAEEHYRYLNFGYCVSSLSYLKLEEY